jgi:hypothetical protein
MSANGELPDFNGELPDFIDEPEEFTEAGIFFSIIDRYLANASKNAQKRLKEELTNPGAEISLRAPLFGNQIGLKVGCEAITFGNFNPAAGKFTTYPELISEEEEQALEVQTLFKRLDAIDDFNLNQGSAMTRTDYDHPQISALHREQQEILWSDYLLYKLMADYRENPNIETDSNLQVDESTIALVSLVPQFFKAEGQLYNITIRLMGAFEDDDGIISRQSHRSFIVAMQDPARPGEFAFKPFRDRIAGFGLETVTELAQELIILQARLSQEGLKFDMEKVALNTKPQRPGS